MITFTGEWVCAERGAPSLYSIGVGLGRTLRFSGQTRRFYSVLSHTLVVAQLIGTIEMEQQFGVYAQPPNLRIHALLHDAAESVCGDTPSTIKTDAAKQVEQDILDRIYASLDVEPPTKREAELLKQADLAALAAEAHVLGHAQAAAWWPRPNGHAMGLTRDELSRAATYLDPDHAATTYMRAVAAARTVPR